VRDEHLALDIVQDAMLKLSEKYSGRPVTEFPMLFQRILQKRYPRFFPPPEGAVGLGHSARHVVRPDNDEDNDPLDTLEVDSGSKVASRPAEQLEQKQVIDIIEKSHSDTAVASTSGVHVALLGRV